MKTLSKPQILMLHEKLIEVTGGSKMCIRDRFQLGPDVATYTTCRCAAGLLSTFEVSACCPKVLSGRVAPRPFDSWNQNGNSAGNGTLPVFLSPADVLHQECRPPFDGAHHG